MWWQSAISSAAMQAMRSDLSLWKYGRHIHSAASNGDAITYFGQRDAKFLLSAVTSKHYSHLTDPEITFAGRSNVGKSSLINAVLRSSSLVKTSKKPGHTSALNFFSLSSRAYPGSITVVDMPGYGFRSHQEWGKFIMEYLSTRKELQRVFMLVEAKVGELKSTDESFLDLVEQYGVSTQIVLTKTDKLKRADLEKISSSIIDAATEIAPTAVLPQAICCSSRAKTNIDQLQTEILRVCRILPTSK
ncbi:putative GTP-binding protein EngB [Coemansia mojavensis]|nr:putative GTP-binding protein EngB [Coemansia mojavensis]